MNRATIFLFCLFFIATSTWAASAQTKLYQAAERGDVSALRKALKAGADVDKQDKDGWTALLFAATEGQEQAVRLLLSAGADPNFAGNKGETPLLCAVMSGKATLVGALLDAGADPKARLNSGQSALDLARLSNAQEIISLLQKVGSVSSSIDIPSIDKEVTKSSAYDEALEHLNTLFQQSRFEFLPGGHREHHLAVIENCVIKLQEKDWLDMYGSDENKDANVTLRQYIFP